MPVFSVSGVCSDTSVYSDASGTSVYSDAGGSSEFLVFAVIQVQVYGDASGIY